MHGANLGGLPARGLLFTWCTKLCQGQKKVSGHQGQLCVRGGAQWFCASELVLGRCWGIGAKPATSHWEEGFLVVSTGFCSWVCSQKWLIILIICKPKKLTFILLSKLFDMCIIFFVWNLVALLCFCLYSSQNILLSGTQNRSGFSMLS